MSNQNESCEILVDLSGIQNRSSKQLRSHVEQWTTGGADGVVLDLFRTNYLVSSVHAVDEARSFRAKQLDREEFLFLHEEFHGDSFAVLPRIFDPKLARWYNQLSDANRILTDGGDITYKRLLETLNETDLSVLLTVKASGPDTIHQALEWLSDTETELIHEEYRNEPDTLDRFSALNVQFDKRPGLADPAGRYERIKDLTPHPSYWIPRFDPDSDEREWTPQNLESIKEKLESSANDVTETNVSFELGTRDREYQKTDRRSLMADRSLAAGSTLSEDMIRELRPGNGLPAEQIDTVTGMIVQRPTDPQEIISY